MDDEKYQKELFELDKPKRFFPRLSDFLPRYDFERNIAFTIALDKAVFISIGIIMVMVAVYALGVEDGKSRIKPKGVINVTTSKPAFVGQGKAAQIRVEKIRKVENPKR